MTKTITKAVLDPEFSSLPGIETVVCTEVCESTQDAAKLLARSGMPEGTLVLSNTQTAGRGRLERQWDSPKGGLYMSFILRPLAKPQDYAGLTIHIAECIARAARECYGVKTRIKHPNDVYACGRNGKWGKVAGILTEACACGEHGDWVVVGIGVNLGNTISKELSEKAVSLAVISGENCSRTRFLKRFFTAFQPVYAAWQTGAASRRQ